MDQAIIIIGAGLLQVPAIQIAKETGLKVIATDRNPPGSRLLLRRRSGRFGHPRCGWIHRDGPKI